MDSQALDPVWHPYQTSSGLETGATPGGHPSKYYPHPMLYNFVELRGLKNTRTITSMHKISFKYWNMKWESGKLGNYNRLVLIFKLFYLRVTSVYENYVNILRKTIQTICHLKYSKTTYLILQNILNYVCSIQPCLCELQLPTCTQKHNCFIIIYGRDIHP